MHRRQLHPCEKVSWEPPAPCPTQWLTSGKIGSISRLLGIKTSFPLVTHLHTHAWTLTHNTPFLACLLCVYLYLSQQSGSCFPVLLYYNTTPSKTTKLLFDSLRRNRLLISTKYCNPRTKKREVLRSASETKPQAVTKSHSFSKTLTHSFPWCLNAGSVEPQMW